MTKIKNTKKGMAKKTLSISLVAAMLATSNVPVWATEFSDGSDAAFSSEAAEVTAEEFTSETVVEETAPVVEDTEVEAAETPVKPPKDTLKINQKGWANEITTEGKVYYGDGPEMDEYYFAWVVDGKIGNRYGIDYGFNDHEGATSFMPSSNDIGKTVVYKVFNLDGINPNLDSFQGSPENYLGETAPVTIGKTNVEYCKNIKTVFDGLEKEIPYGSPTSQNIDLTVTFDNQGVVLTNKDFYIETALLPETGNGKDAESVYRIKATPKDQSLYTGTLRFDYKIGEKTYERGDIIATLNKTYEYTGNVIKPAVSDLSLTDKWGKKLVSEEVIDSITVNTTDEDSKVTTTPYTVNVNVSNVPNFTAASLKGEENITATPGYKVVARNLANCNVEVESLFYNGKPIEGKNDVRFDGKIRITDAATGEELNLKSVWDGNGGAYDYDVIVETLPTSGTRKYKLTVQAPTTGATGNTTGSKTVEFTIGNLTFEESGYGLVDGVEDYLKEAVAFNNKDVVKDLSKVVFKNEKGDILSKENYDVKVIGKNAGTKAGKVIIEGKGSYAGYNKVYYFDIMPAYAESVSAAKKVIFEKGYTAASQYAPKVNVTASTAVKDKDGNWVSSGKKDLVLSADDFKVSYSFDKYNAIGQKVVSTIRVTSKNYLTGTTVLTATNTIISRKSLANCKVTAEPASYTYTGGVIIPTLKVMDGTEVLTEDVDYEISGFKNATDVGTGTVFINGKDENEKGPGIYDPETTNSATFTITPAKAEDVTIVWADGNTGVKYTGTNLKPTIAKITLNGNDVSKQFDISYPKTNINVGTGHVTLTPVKGNKNFIGTKDATFKIVPRELDGTLKVYDVNDLQYTIDEWDDTKWLVDTRTTINGNYDYVRFAYDGKEHTFSRAEFVPTGAYAKYVTADDYEIKYVDNTYGEIAYIYVIGKGNFAGKDMITDATGNVIKSVVDKNAFIIENYEIKKQHVTIEDGEYAAGQPVRPNVKVVIGGKELVENEHYILEYKAVSDLTSGKTLKVIVKGINGYNGRVEGYWGVVKKNMANASVVLDKKEYKKDEKPVVTVFNSGMKVPETEYTVAYGDKSLTVTAAEGSKYYTGSQEVEVVREAEKVVGAPSITGVKVVGNQATVVLGGEAAEAEGYDYVISTDRDCITKKNYDKVNKNVLRTETTFTYAQQGTYYAYCHAWKRDENGKKVFGEWSKGYQFYVNAVTPDQPAITSVKVSGSTVTVTYTEAAHATGYDVVLGTAMKKVAGENRPVNYGTLVKKNIKNGVVTATFKNVPKGTYYAGLHAFNRNTVDGKKVFSPWSNAKKVTVK